MTIKYSRMEFALLYLSSSRIFLTKVKKKKLKLFAIDGALKNFFVYFLKAIFIAFKDIEMDD